MNTLCFDFGNTRLKLAFFQNTKLIEVIVIEADEIEIIDGFLKEFEPQKTILSSVIDHNPGIETLLAEKTKFHKLNYLSKLPFTTPVGKPETIGADRLALAAAAVYFFPKQHNLVIGMANEIDGFINTYKERYGNFNVHLTGGDLVYLAPHLKNQIFADPELIFKGLFAISEVNNQ